jgi:hypothetical protein
MPANSGMTNFPSGFAAGLSVRGMPLLQTQPGNVFWVDNSPTPSGGPSSGSLRTVGGSDNNHGTFTRPFASLNYALSQCQQGNGDIIFVKPGHIEYVNGAGTTLNPTVGPGANAASTAIALGTGGVAIVGLGVGSARPTIVFRTATTANIPVRAGGVSIQNFLFLCNFAAVASAFTGITASVTASIAASTGIMTVTVVGSGTLYPGANLVGTGVISGTMILSQLTGTTGGIGTYQTSATNAVAVGSTTITAGPQDFDIENCEFRDLSSSLNLLTVFTDTGAANTCDGFRFVGNRIKSLGTTAATTALVCSAGHDRWTITDNYGNWAVLNDTAAMLATGANSLTQFEFSRNFINRPNTSTNSGLAISTSGTAWTGQCNDNRIWGLNNSAQKWIDTGSKLAFNQNFCTITAAADKSGLINPAAV